MNRAEFANLGLDGNEKILEFGPSYNPMFPKKNGWNAEIVDWTSTENLRNEGYTSTFNGESIEEVDYVCSGDYYSYISSNGGGNYDVIAASHFIEHTTDIILFLQDCSKLLSHSGIIKLVIPDKRYEFDTFREVTS